MLEAILALGGAGELFVAAREVAIVLGLHFPAVVLGDVIPAADPIEAEWGKTFNRVKRHAWIAPRAAAIVDADRLVRLQFAAERFRVRLRDLPERDTNVGMQFAFDINAPAIRHHVVAALRFEGVFGRDHKGRINLKAIKPEKEDVLIPLLVSWFPNSFQESGSKTKRPCAETHGQKINSSLP